LKLSSVIPDLPLPVYWQHFLSLPLFAPLFPSLPSTLATLSAQSSPTQLSLLPLLPPSLALSPDGPSWLPRLVDMLGVDLKLELPVKQIWTALALNVLTQAVCVTGVNRLTSRVSSLTTTLILTLRKALSLFLSIYFYQAGQAGLGIWLGGFLVLGELPSLALHYATVRQRLMPRLLIDSRDGRLLGRIEPSAVRPKERY
jgi:UDP-xylose/UDP-N-acetylglucosamine transporter B4